jgi:hypothetical protein
MSLSNFAGHLGEEMGRKLGRQTEIREHNGDAHISIIELFGIEAKDRC